MISNTIQVSHISPTSQEKDIQSLSTLELKIFMLLSDVSKYCSKVYMTRETIALRVGCCTKTVSRATSKLNKLGLITKYRKFIGKIEKCSYKVASQFIGYFKKQIQKFSTWLLRSLPVTNRNVPVVNSSLILNSFSKEPTHLTHVSKESYNVENSGGWVKKFQNEKDVVEMSLIVSTPATNRAAEELNLTPWGKIRLRLFEDEVIFYALDMTKNAKGLRDPFAYFFRIATKYSSEKRIALDNKRYSALAEAYMMPAEAPMIFKEGEENLKGEKVTYKNKAKMTERAYNPEAEKYGELSRRKDQEWEERKREMEEKEELIGPSKLL